MEGSPALGSDIARQVAIAFMGCVLRRALSLAAEAKPPMQRRIPARWSLECTLEEFACEFHRSAALDMLFVETPLGASGV